MRPGEPSGLLTHTAITAKGLSFGQMKYCQHVLNLRGSHTNHCASKMPNSSAQSPPCSLLLASPSEGQVKRMRQKFCEILAVHVRRGESLSVCIHQI